MCWKTSLTLNTPFSPGSNAFHRNAGHTEQWDIWLKWEYIPYNTYSIRLLSEPYNPNQIWRQWVLRRTATFQMVRMNELLVVLYCRKGRHYWTCTVLLSKTGLKINVPMCVKLFRRSIGFIMSGVETELNKSWPCAPSAIGFVVVFSSIPAPDWPEFCINKTARLSKTRKPNTHE